MYLKFEMSNLEEIEQDEELEWEHDELDERLELHDDDSEEELEEDSKINSYSNSANSKRMNSY